MEWMYNEHNHEIHPECDSSFNSMEKDSITNKLGMDSQASISDANLSLATVSEKHDSPGATFDEVGVKSDNNPAEMQSESHDGLDECTYQINEEISKNDENIVIKSLKEEVIKFNTNTVPSIKLILFNPKD